MEIRTEEDLSNYTTFKMGGLAKKIYFPEDVEDLKTIQLNDINAFSYILGGGSNLLINDQKVFPSVISIRKLNDRIMTSEVDGQYYVGAGVTLQKMIRSVNKQGYGGIEYLFSVPGLVGGAIYMNAGRGRMIGKSISDHILSVDYYQDGQVYTIAKQDCAFGYRTSIFQRMQDIVILGAAFDFRVMEREESQRNIEERLELCRNTQDNTAPNMGSVFKKCDAEIMEKMRKSSMRTGVIYSNKTSNWLLNCGGTFEQALLQIESVEKMHICQEKECSLEIKIWN